MGIGRLLGHRATDRFCPSRGDKNWPDYVRSTMAGEVMAELFPPELSGLLDSPDASSKEEAWQRFVNRHSRLLLTTARETCADYDDGMERYAFLLDELKRDDCQRLRKYLADGRGKFTT